MTSLRSPATEAVAVAIPIEADEPIEAAVPVTHEYGGGRPFRIVAWAFIGLMTLYFFFPLLMLMRAGFQKGVPTVLLGRSTIFKGWTFEPLVAALQTDGFTSTLWMSFKLGLGAIIVTLALMLPTAMWVHLRIPKARGIVETLTILPYVVPPIALVVGVIGAFQHGAPWFYRSNYLLVPFYAILAMPFTYRSLDAGIRAIDLRTLVDASRSLGAGWFTTMFRVLIPNMRVALLTSAFLTATVVLGEFTMASLTGKQTLPTFSAELYSGEFQLGAALGFVTLILTTALLAFVTFATGRRGAASTLA